MKKYDAAGFTLIEVLLTISIFSLLSLTAYFVLQNALNTERNFKLQTERIAEIKYVFYMLERDLSHAIILKKDGGNNEMIKNFSAGEGVIDSDSHGVEFIRNNWFNYDGFFRRPELERVGYRLKDNVLERVRGEKLNKPIYITEASKKNSVVPIIHRVSTFNIELYHDGVWTSAWSDDGKVPEAILIILYIEDIGRVSKLIRLNVAN